MKIQFERKYAMKNGNKITKKNWHKIVAVSNKPCTSIRGVPAIDRVIESGGQYFEKWVLKYEEAHGEFPAGYIFREINHGCGISGNHPTPKKAVWSAMNNRISVYLEE